MDVGSFLNTGDVVIFTIKCLKIIIFDEDLSGGQQFLCVSGYIMGDILQYICIKLQNPILMLTPMCQDTPCQISNMCDNVCNFNEMLFWGKDLHLFNLNEIVLRVKDVHFQGEKSPKAF